MTKKQKLILIGFAILDVLVIGGLVYAVWSSSQPMSPVSYTLTACETSIQQALLPQYSASFSETEDTSTQLTLRLYTDSHDADEQVLWHILDTLKTALPQGCQNLESLTIHLTTRQPEAYTFTVAMDDFIAWTDQQIDDSTLAARILYRQVTRNTD